MNGQIETVETKPISLELRSIHSNVSTRVTAFTADRVTGSMTVVNPSEPIARLTPPGWTCIENLGSKRRHLLQTNFACTYFVKNQLEIEILNLEQILGN